LDVINVITGRVVGTGVDCLSDVVMGEDGSMHLFGTTFFTLAAGEIVTQGHITVQPALRPAVTREGLVATHITGAASDAEDTVVSGTNTFKNLAANVRLQGMIDSSSLDEGILRFSCYFTFTNIHTK
jgi:hypothetical protein